MIHKRILSLLLALLMVLTILPAAMAEPTAEPTAVYAYSKGGIDFYACDETGCGVANKPYLAEVNRDKAIDAKDALLILQYAVNKIDVFPIEKQTNCYKRAFTLAMRKKM